MAVRSGGADGLAAMLNALADYGAECASWSGAGWSLGLRCRSAAQLPPTQAGGDPGGLAVVASARLDNRDELGDALGLSPAAASALADRDFILAAYRRWGRECPERLLGDYAFAVWDAGRGLLFCARDHMGVRPLYYAETPRGFAFASALEGVLAAPGVSDELDESVVLTFLTDALVTPSRTFFRAVRKLPAGHSLTVKGGAVRLRRWWRPEELPRLPPASDDDYAAQFLHLYRQAVRDRLRGPDPVGVHLSGGLDSSSIAVLAARELRSQGRPPPLAFTLLPVLGEAPGDRAHEADYAAVAAVAEQEGLRVFHEAPDLHAAAFRAADPVFPAARDPAGEGVVQRRAVAQGVRVLLSGWGGDEGVSFLGRGHYAALLLRGRWARFLAETRAAGENPLEEAAIALLMVLPEGNKLRVAVRRLRKRLRGVPVLERRVVVNAEFARSVRPLPKKMRLGIGVRRIQLFRLLVGSMTNVMEFYAASGARCGLEYRYPLADRRLLEFALGLPPEQFKRPEGSRWLMRHALSPRRPCPHAEAPILPTQVGWYRRQARETPESDELQLANALRSIQQDLAGSPPPPRARYIDMARLMECLDFSRLGERWIAKGEVIAAVMLLNLTQAAVGTRRPPAPPSRPPAGGEPP